jgi:hypothetical protein
MGNADLVNVGKMLALAGFFSIMVGFSLFAATEGGVCSVPLQPPGSTGTGCASDYTPLILPTVIGGALVVAGAWLFWMFKPSGWKTAGPI